jgi:predicted RecB family endonuclease
MKVHALKYCAVLCFLASAVFGQELNWAELARRPELWPADCTAKAEMKFDGGVTIRPGQKLNVLKVLAAEVQVQSTDGHTTFTADPDETDVLAVAQAAYAKLTPKQRALTYQTIVGQKDVWPQHVTITRGFDVAPGKPVRSGEQVEVLEVLADRVAVQSESLKARFQVAVQATDLMAKARKLVEDDKAMLRFVDVKKQQAAQQMVAEQKKQTHGPVLMELEPDLVSSVTGKPAPFDANALPRYIVLFRGSSTCSITRQFAPTLIKYYDQMKPRHPDFEIIYLMTETPEATSKFARELGFSWRAIPYQHSYMPTVTKPIQSLLPQLVVMDRSGRVLANGWQNTAPYALKQLDALLRASPVARP